MQEKEQKDNKGVKHYTETTRSSNTNPTKPGGGGGEFGRPEGQSVSALHLTPVVLLLWTAYDMEIVLDTGIPFRGTCFSGFVILDLYFDVYVS